MAGAKPCLCHEVADLAARSASEPSLYRAGGQGRLRSVGGEQDLQCLTNLDQLPPTGAVIISVPLKIEAGSGSPLRVVAMVGS